MGVFDVSILYDGEELIQIYEFESPEKAIDYYSEDIQYNNEIIAYNDKFAIETTSLEAADVFLEMSGEETISNLDKIPASIGVDAEESSEDEVFEIIDTLGTTLLIGLIVGRVFCGYICPVGIVQGVLYKIKTPKFELPEKVDKVLIWFKYVVLIVLILPLLSLIFNLNLINPFETLATLEVFLLAFIIVLSIFTYKPFCKYACPVGAIFGLTNRFSFYKMKVNELECTNCKKCERNCMMNVAVLKNINSTECIRCGKCKKVCPKDAIKSGFKTKYN